MATKKPVYLALQEAVKFYVLYMRQVGETRFGVFDKNLLESALERPRHASGLENADLVRQTATLIFGLVKNHPWVGGNKRTATLLASLFLKRNGRRIVASTAEIIKVCLDVESGEWAVDEIEYWLRSRIKKAV